MGGMILRTLLFFLLALGVHAADAPRPNVGDILRGTSRGRTRPLMWEWRFRIAGEPFHHSPQFAIHDGDWKLLLNPDRTRVELYDLTKDLTQLNNVAEHHPDLVARLSEQVLAWQQGLPPGPRDPGAGQMNFNLPKRARD
jgi:hypothetical protein